jgi:hypothetical protein
MNYHCHACGHLGNRDKRDYLEAHEAYDINYTTGRVALKKIVALCRLCHRFIHSGFTEMLLERGEITKAQFNEIKAHGFKVLSDAGLSLHRDVDDIDPEEVCAWSDWYLELDGERHYSPFKNYEDWKRHWRERDGVPDTKRCALFFGPFDRRVCDTSLKGFFDRVLEKHHEGGPFDWYEEEYGFEDVYGGRR